MPQIIDSVTSLALFLEREAGHLVLSCALIWIGMMLCDPIARAQAAHDLVVFGLGVLSRSMGSRQEETGGSATTRTPQ